MSKVVRDKPAWVVFQDAGTWWFPFRNEAFRHISEANAKGAALTRPIRIDSANFNQEIPTLVVPKK